MDTFAVPLEMFDAFHECMRTGMFRGYLPAHDMAADADIASTWAWSL